MAKKYNQRIGITVLFLALAPSVGPDAVEAGVARVMEGQILTGALDEKAIAERATPRRIDPAAPVGYEMRLTPIAAAEIAAKTEPEPIKGFGSLVKIGDHRELPPAYRAEMAGRDLVWEPARDGGEVAVFSVSSPGAKSLRVAIDFHRLPRGAEVRFYSPAEPIAEGGPFDAGFLTSSRKSLVESDFFWSPVVRGETTIVEIWVPAFRRGADVRLSVRRVSHIEHALDAKDLRHLGNSGSCNQDIACFNKWRTAADAVAKIVFEFGGGTALCTGQLMANEKGKLLFLTASHCISTRSEAGSATFFWQFQRASCKGSNPTSVLQTGGGAKLLFTSLSGSKGLVTDHTLMQLKRDPTSVLGSVTSLGWVVGEDPEDNLRAKVHGIHHPGGDVKRGSRGSIKDTWQLTPEGGLVGANPPTHYEVVWKKGTTEGGSSGSAILIGKVWPEQFVVGVLTGGFASCSAKREPDFYGLFEETFRRFKKFRKHF